VNGQLASHAAGASWRNFATRHGAPDDQFVTRNRSASNTAETAGRRTTRFRRLLESPGLEFLLAIPAL